MLYDICCHGHHPFVCLSILLLFTCVQSADYTLGMDSESSCTKTHYYEKGDIFTASVNGKVHNSYCPLTFIESETRGGGTAHTEPCLSLCVQINSYSLDSCEVTLAYHNGLNDTKPDIFNCHKVPPSMWCSGENDLRVVVSEKKNYAGADYSITLQIVPFCGSTHDRHTTDDSVVAKPKTKNGSMNRTALIVGAVVGTVSILFVVGWMLFCCVYKGNGRGHSASNGPTGNSSVSERNHRGTTPIQQATRYAPVLGYGASSHSSSDRGHIAAGTNTGPAYGGNIDRGPPGVTGIPGALGAERRLYSPFQPPVPQRPHFPGIPGQHQVIYSDIDRNLGGDKWYLGGDISASANQESKGYGGAGQGSQYLSQNHVYNYPLDGEMHTAPTDTRYVVYDFDYESQPSERKYSAGKHRNLPGQKDSPVKEIDRSRPREITPLREMTNKRVPPISVSRVPPPVDSTTTDHTSDYESSASEVTEDDTTTDDQVGPMARYNYRPPLGYQTQGKPPGIRPLNSDSSFRHYNFRHIDSNVSVGMEDRSVPRVLDKSSASLNASVNVGSSAGAQSEEMFVDGPLDECMAGREPLSSNHVLSGDLSQTPSDGLAFGESGRNARNPGDISRQTDRGQLSESALEGPRPQVPTLPRDVQRSTRPVTTSSDLPWPHGPPPPYSLVDKVVV